MSNKSGLKKTFSWRFGPSRFAKKMKSEVSNSIRIWRCPLATASIVDRIREISRYFSLGGRIFFFGAVLFGKEWR